MSCVGFFSSALLIISVASAEIEDRNTLEHVIVIARHGSRTPLDPTYYGDPNTDFLRTGAGQLTEKGTRLMNKYGKTIKERYGSFFVNDYRTLYARSSYVTRCLQSGEAILSAIYPREYKPLTEAEIRENNTVQSYQAIPIYTMPPQFDGVLNSNALNALTIVDRQFLNRLLSQEFVSMLMGEVSFATGTQSITAQDLLSLYDGLKCEEYEGLVLPPWFDDIFPRLSMANDAAFREWSTNFTYSIPFAGNLAVTVLNDLVNPTVSSDTNVLIKTHYYFTHDNVIAAFLGLLGAPLKTAPTFGATVLIEKHVNHRDGSTIVKLFYLNAPDANFATITLPRCSASDQHCTLEKFQAIVQSLPIT